jgi:hypothetical protein
LALGDCYHGRLEGQPGPLWISTRWLPAEGSQDLGAA